MKCHRLASSIDLQPVIDGSGRCPCLVAVPRCDSHLSQQHAGAFAFIMLCARLGRPQLQNHSILMRPEVVVLNERGEGMEGLRG